MQLPARNPVMHNRQASVYAGDYQVTDAALANYGVTREKFGSTDIVLPDGSSFNVKDYQYILDTGEVGMYFIPVNDYGLINAADGSTAYASELVDQYIRMKMKIKETDPLYTFIYFFHPELNKNTIQGFSETEKTEMGITHLGAYYGQGVTSNSPPLYHHRQWGVNGEVFNKYGYPSNVMIISMEGVDQAMLNKNFLVTDKFLNYGIRFPKDYKNSQFRMIDINTCLMFYRDWIREAQYLKNDTSWFTYCAAHKTLVATVALNLPHNRNAFIEIYGADGSAFYDDFLKNYYELTGYDFTTEEETDFEPLWKKQGFIPEQIRPFTLEEYNAYDAARRAGKLDSFTGFKPLKPTDATAWGPQYAADVIFDFVEAYADFLDAGAIVSCATVMGYYIPVTERLGISGEAYLMDAMPILEILMFAHAKIYAAGTHQPDYHKSTYYNETFAQLYVAFGGKQENLASALNNLQQVESFEGDLNGFVQFLLKQSSILPEFIAWWAMWKVRLNWNSIITSNPLSPEDAYTWMKNEITQPFNNVREIVAVQPDKIEFNTPPSIAHMVELGMFPKNPFVTFKTICTVMEHKELEPKKKS